MKGPDIEHEATTGSETGLSTPDAIIWFIGCQ